MSAQHVEQRMVECLALRVPSVLDLVLEDVQRQRRDGAADYLYAAKDSIYLERS
jgi:hypothetical protein